MKNKIASDFSHPCNFTFSHAQSFVFFSKKSGWKFFYSLCRRHDTEKRQRVGLRDAFHCVKFSFRLLCFIPTAKHPTASHFPPEKIKIFFILLSVRGWLFHGKNVYIRTFISTNHPTLDDTHTQYCHTISTAIATFTALAELFKNEEDYFFLFIFMWWKDN